MTQATMRLNKFLSEAGVCSRRAADQAIDAGRVKINGQMASLGMQVDPQTDRVEFDGKSIQLQAKKYVYYALYKPKGTISTSQDEKGRNNVVDLVPKLPRVYPIGRLDKDSEGLIILTNDGELANYMMHPKFEHEKVYEVTAKSTEAFDPAEVKLKFEKGIVIDGKRMKADQVEVTTDIKRKDTVRFRVALHMGYNRQIRRMCGKIGLEVLKLRRIAIGKLKLANLDLQPGEYKKIQKSNLV